MLCPNSSALAKGCIGNPPTQTYFEHDSPYKSPRAKNIITSRLGGVSTQPNVTSKLYTQSNLICWAGDGDKIAAYIIAFRNEPTYEMGETALRIDDGQSALDINYLIMSASGRVEGCTRATSEPFCAGIPDAQYLVALGLKKRSALAQGRGWRWWMTLAAKHGSLDAKRFLNFYEFSKRKGQQ